MSSSKAKPAAKTTPGKVFDVRRPGKAPASATSRPVIVGHKPEVQDSVVGVSGVGDSPRQPLLNPKRRAIGVRPIDVDTAGAEPPKASEEPTVVTSSVPPLPEVESDSVPITVAKKEPIVAEHSSQTEEVLATTALTGTAEPPREQPDQTAVSAPEPAAPVEQSESTPDLLPTPTLEPAKSVEPEQPAPEKPQQAAEPSFDPWPELTDESQIGDKTAPESAYEIQPIVVSHHHPAGHAWKVILLLLLIVILAAAAVDILLDAGIIEIPGIPHTNFLEG